MQTTHLETDLFGPSVSGIVVPEGPWGTQKSTRASDPRAARILAQSLFREMSENGVSCEHVLAVASELIQLVTEELDSEEPHQA